MLEIGLVDDHQVVREGMAGIISRTPDMGVTFEADNAEDALARLNTQVPDVVLLDLNIPGGGAHVLGELKRRGHPAKCAVFTVNDDPVEAIKVMDLGARAYILKGSSAEDIVSAIRIVASGRTYVSPEFAAPMLEAAGEAKRQRALTERLTHRELQIIGEIAKGLTNREAAERLKISEKTVKHYMTSVMHKYNVSNRVSAVVEFQKSK